MSVPPWITRQGFPPQIVAELMKDPRMAALRSATPDYAIMLNRAKQAGAWGSDRLPQWLVSFSAAGWPNEHRGTAKRKAHTFDGNHPQKEWDPRNKVAFWTWMQQFAGRHHLIKPWRSGLCCPALTERSLSNADQVLGQPAGTVQRVLIGDESLGSARERMRVTKHFHDNGITMTDDGRRVLTCEWCDGLFYGKVGNEASCPDCHAGNISHYRRIRVARGMHKAAQYRRRALVNGPPRPHGWQYLVMKRDGYSCVYCGMTRKDHAKVFGEDLTIDHVVPLSKGGADADANLVTACRRCNSSKRDKDVILWAQSKGITLSDTTISKYNEAIKDAHDRRIAI
jgi:5-methylcytosine-specific restriction endonuclease McrA